MTDLVERLRSFVSGPHERGAKYSTASWMPPEVLLEAADRITALEAEVGRMQQEYVDANEARIDAEAALTTATGRVRVLEDALRFGVEATSRHGGAAEFLKAARAALNQQKGGE